MTTSAKTRPVLLMGQAAYEGCYLRNPIASLQIVLVEQTFLSRSGRGAVQKGRYGEGPAIIMLSFSGGEGPPANQHKNETPCGNEVSASCCENKVP